MYIYFWAANCVFLLPIAGQLYGSLEWHLSFSERGAKGRGVASGVGGIMRREAKSGYLLREAAPLQGCSE